MTDNKWITMWGNATSIGERRAENYGKNLTLRYPIYTPFDASALRITFSNYCGTEPITITRANVAMAATDKEIISESAVAITFAGKESVTIEPGTEIVSDELPFAVKRGKDISVSFYLKDFTELRSTVLITGPLSGGFFAVGDQAYEQELTLKDSKSTNWYYFLNKVEVLTDKVNRAVVCFGDSITSQDWPDYLSLRLQEEKKEHTAIVRRAVSGTRILREYDCITYASYGLKGANRFRRELETVTGADTVIIQHGINDIIHPVGVENNPFRPWSDLPTADELIEGLKEYVTIAHELGLKVYIGTLLPIRGWRTDAPFREEIRVAMNEWIRTNTEAEGCIDFDKALRNESNPAAFRAGFDSGDHLHPGKAAYAEMAKTVPAAILQ